MSKGMKFIDECSKLPSADVEFSLYVEDAMSKYSDVTITEEELRLFLKTQPDDGCIISIADGIVRCIKYCEIKESKYPDNKKKSDFVAFKKLLISIEAMIESILHEPSTAESPIDSNILTAMKSYEDKIRELNLSLQNVQIEVERERGVNESRMSSLITNNITILGIFVAIAFAGFGSTAIFSNMPLSVDASVVQNTFYIILMAVLIYNLVLILLWFLYCFSSYRVSPASVSKFRLKSFLIIDIVMIIADVGLFFLC